MTWLEAMDQCTCDTLNECSLFAHGTATRPAQMTPYVSCSRTPSETVLTAFGVTSTIIWRCTRWSDGGRVYILGSALGCGLSSGYGFLSGAWPFGIVEAIWAVFALRRLGLTRES